MSVEATNNGELKVPPTHEQALGAALDLVQGRAALNQERAGLIGVMSNIAEVKATGESTGGDVIRALIRAHNELMERIIERGQQRLLGNDIELDPVNIAELMFQAEKNPNATRIILKSFDQRESDIIRLGFLDRVRGVIGVEAKEQPRWLSEWEKYLNEHPGEYDELAKRVKEYVEPTAPVEEAQPAVPVTEESAAKRELDEFFADSQVKIQKGESINGGVTLLEKLYRAGVNVGDSTFNMALQLFPPEPSYIRELFEEKYTKYINRQMEGEQEQAQAEKPAVGQIEPEVTDFAGASESEPAEDHEQIPIEKIEAEMAITTLLHGSPRLLKNEDTRFRIVNQEIPNILRATNLGPEDADFIVRILEGSKGILKPPELVTILKRYFEMEGVELK